MAAGVATVLPGSVHESKHQSKDGIHTHGHVTLGVSRFFMSKACDRVGMNRDG